MSLKRSLADVLDTWHEAIAPALDGGKAVALGLFDVHGTALYLNTGMRALLQPVAGHDGHDGHDDHDRHDRHNNHNNAAAPRLSHLQMPGFTTLTSRPAPDDADQPIYSGWLSFGGKSLSYRSLHGHVYRRRDELLFVCEYDVDDITRTNEQVTTLNSEITNLQRDLARKNAELAQTLAELRDTQALLVQSEKMNALGQMVAGVAHEINNPVSFIYSNLHSLSASVRDIVDAFRAVEAVIESDGSDTQRAQLQAIRKRADLDFTLEDMEDLLSSSQKGLQRVKHLVQNLRTFSRLDEAEIKTVDLSEGIQSALMIAQPALGERVNVVLSIDDDLPQVRCYPAELNQVFLNIIINAAQAIDGPGTITIDGHDRGDAIMITFSDTGQGIAPDVLPRIFDPFFTTKPVGSGTGLGLTIAYKIITDRHQGALDVESTPGEGTAFTITLPKDCRK